MHTQWCLLLRLSSCDETCNLTDPLVLPKYLTNKTNKNGRLQKTAYKVVKRPNFDVNEANAFPHATTPQQVLKGQKRPPNEYMNETTV